MFDGVGATGTKIGTATGGNDVSLRGRIHNKKDVAAGLLFVAIGAATIIGASDYPRGTIRSIGPGYFPIMLGIVLALPGAGVAFQGMSFDGAVDASTGRDQAQAREDDDGIAIRPNSPAAQLYGINPTMRPAFREMRPHSPVSGRAPRQIRIERLLRAGLALARPHDHVMVELTHLVRTKTPPNL